jgi:hypothetical protein
VWLWDLGASGLFTPTAALSLNARWEDIRLGPLTSGTTFGKIQGVVRGSVENLEFAYGQPQRFQLFLETVERADVKQKVSVKAVDNIARIGGGESPFVGLAGAISVFFKELSYSKIGVRASLKNDVFRINGTIHQDGTEYIMKRGSFSGVDIVNQNTDNQIRFKDMMKRIQRIQSTREAPVIQ